MNKVISINSFVIKDIKQCNGTNEIDGAETK